MHPSSPPPLRPTQTVEPVTRVRRRQPSKFRPTDFVESVEQRTNALKNAAKAAAERPKRQKPDLDWDAMILRLHAMLDALED